MRIVPTAIITAIMAVSAGCGGSSSSSSRSLTQAATQKTSAGTTTTSAPTAATSARTKKGSKSARTATTAPIRLVGRRLDVAERMLKKAGISYVVIPLHGHGRAAAAGWGVCETRPAAASSDAVPRIDLLVAHLRCGAH